MIEVIEAEAVKMRPAVAVYFVLGRMGAAYWSFVGQPQLTVEEAEKHAAAYTGNYECFRIVRVDGLPVRLPEVQEV